ncbi:hypothetical protein SEA_ANEEM_96 [Mycobacterium phage Aneem]|nr:hypothetical protein SEA_ET2BRUTUS_95 [Mycobacterium phage Et2Brutus]QBI98463.1 hypothetical protein SEA_MUNCH_94 [Mycobacterium phage Munch]QGZ16510.1 hypothetical protein SEA_ANEEM_96 [Mycobacterium phage Aneem]UAW08965.1 hypothetical protein SEA_LUCIVIA_96 [Mycobacterium phage Lucivia]
MVKVEHIEAKDIKVGDFVLTKSSLDNGIVYGDTVSQRYEYDEFTYINYGDVRWPNDAIVSVIRQEA